VLAEGEPFDSPRARAQAGPVAGSMPAERHAACMAAIEAFAASM
jgi:hypothetical protein